MNKKSKILIILFIYAFILGFNIDPGNIYADRFFDETKILTVDSLQFIEPPADFRNYFMFQSIDDTSIVLIGDFVSSQKIITLIIDEGSDNVVDSVVEYFPETKKYKKKLKLSSRFMKSGIKELKKEIIEGTVYEQNYSYSMGSLNDLKIKLNKGTDIYNSEGGWVVIKYDSDKTKSPMNRYYFRLKDERCDLIFKTNYYRLYTTVIKPPIAYSVYCKNSKDPVVEEYVKNLLKMVPF